MECVPPPTKNNAIGGLLPLSSIIFDAIPSASFLTIGLIIILIFSDFIVFSKPSTSVYVTSSKLRLSLYIQQYENQLNIPVILLL